MGDAASHLIRAPFCRRRRVVVAARDGIPGDTKTLLGGDRPPQRRGYKAHRRSGDVRITPKGGTTCREGSTRSTPAKIASGPCQPPPTFVIGARSAGD